MDKFVKLRFTPEHFEELEALAHAESLTVGAFIKVCVRDELRRRGATKPGAGRPPIDPEFRVISRRLLECYERLRATYDSEFEEIFGVQFRKLAELIENKDLVGLKHFEENRPWVVTK